MLTNGEVYLKGVGIFKNLFTFETKSDTLTYNFKTPSVTSKVDISPDQKLVYFDGSAEHEISYAADTSKAKTTQSYWLGFTPFVSETKVNTPGRDINPIQTPSGPVEITAESNKSVQP